MGRTLISRHDSPLGRWTHALYLPAMPLAAHVEMFWYVAGRTHFVRDRRLPTGKSHLMFNLGDAQTLFGREVNTASREFRTSWISGQQQHYFETGSSGYTVLVGAQFHSHGAYRALRIAQHELSDQVIELDALLGNGVHVLREQLADAATPETCFALLERWLLALLERGARVHPAVLAASHAIGRDCAQVRLAALARDTGLSKEHLIRRFREQIGLTPKAYANVLRFQRARQLARQNRLGWSEIAQSCGYYDQSHLVRDFQRFAGRTPTGLLRERTPDDDSIVIA